MKHARDDYNRIQDPAGLIPEDEPVFLIRGQDISAVPTLLAWARSAEMVGASKEIVQMVRDHASDMILWQEQHGSKVADL